MAGEKKHITRNRISYSCQKCRQRKVKCDKVHPICGSCEKTGEECVYSSNEPENQASQEQQADVGHGKKRKQSLAGSNQDNSDRDEDANETHNLENQLTQLSVLLNQLGKIVGPGIADTTNARISGDSQIDPNALNAHTSNHENTTSQTESTQTSEALDSRHERSVSERTRKPDLDAISAQLERLTNLLRVQTSNVTRDSAIGRYEDEASDSLSQSLVRKADIGLAIPNEHQRNALFRCWLSSVYPVLPVIEPHLALMHYRTFHFWYLHGLEKGVPNPSEEYVPLNYAIYYAGVISISPRGLKRWFPGISRQRILSQMKKSFQLTLRAPVKQLTNPLVMAARVMMYYLSPPDSDEVGLNSTTASLLRMAYSLNLHRERPSETIEMDRAEARRRLWWEVANLDTLESTATSTPPLINHHFCDTLISSELKDSELGTTNGNKYLTMLQEGQTPDVADDPTTVNRSSMISVIFLVMKARTLVASYARKLLNINLAAKSKTKEDMLEVRKLLEEAERYIKSVINRIPAKGIPEMNFAPASKPGHSLSFDHSTITGDDLLSKEVEAISGAVVRFDQWEMPFVIHYRQALIAFHKWARILLSMLIDQLQCFSYAPFLSNSRKRTWSSARLCALKHAHSCLRKFNALATDLELEKFRWTWPRMYQPIHACMTILIDVYERPMSREAPRSRALFDQMLLLSNPSHGIVGGEDGLTNTRPLQESGNEAFMMLMQLRAKAWQKVGLNPNFLWTEQDQIDIGVATPLTESDKLAQSMREDVILENFNANPSEQQHLLRPIIEQRAREYTHPSLVGPPDPTVPKNNIETLEACTTHVAKQKHPSQRLARARPDQERAPLISSTRTFNQEDLSRHLYKFRPPSELYDVGELIRKIKDFQQSSQQGKNAEAAVLGQQIATTNIDLTNLLANTIPTHGVATPRELDTQMSGTQSTDQTSSSSGKNPPPPQQQQSSISNPPTTSFLAAPSAAASAVTIPEDSVNTQTQTPTDLLASDFDWAKWDEIFGHILDDDGFDDAVGESFQADENAMDGEDAAVDGDGGNGGGVMTW